MKKATTLTTPTIAGGDAGYGYTKFVTGGVIDNFPSVLGYPEKIRYTGGDILSHQQATRTHLTINGEEYYIGDTALEQSSVNWSPQDRDRIKTTVTLLVAACARAGITGPVQLVTGLPVNWYNQDKDVLTAALDGQHTYTNHLNGAQGTIEFISPTVAPQPFGAFFTQTLTPAGGIKDAELARQLTGVCDIGMHTTDFSASDHFQFRQPMSGSVQIGVSQVFDLVSKEIENSYRMELDLHQVDQIIRRGKLNVGGTEHSLAAIVEPIVSAVALKILDRAGRIWTDTARHLSRIFIVGGGASLIGPYLQARWPHATILTNSATANARGFYQYALHKWSTRQQQPQTSPNGKVKA